jgi:hypothetical protein
MIPPPLGPFYQLRGPQGVCGVVWIESKAYIPTITISRRSLEADIVRFRDNLGCRNLMEATLAKAVGMRD